MRLGRQCRHGRFIAEFGPKRAGLLSEQHIETMHASLQRAFERRDLRRGRLHLAFGLSQGVDYVALSFVRSAALFAPSRIASHARCGPNAN